MKHRLNNKLWVLLGTETLVFLRKRKDLILNLTTHGKRHTYELVQLLSFFVYFYNNNKLLTQMFY